MNSDPDGFDAKSAWRKVFLPDHFPIKRLIFLTGFLVVYAILGRRVENKNLLYSCLFSLAGLALFAETISEKIKDRTAAYNWTKAACAGLVWGMALYFYHLS